MRGRRWSGHGQMREPLLKLYHVMRSLSNTERVYKNEAVEQVAVWFYLRV